MGLPARQRRVLEHIDCTLRGSDPKLAALYAIFARLNRGEEMPRIEQVRQGLAVTLARFVHMLAILLVPFTWLRLRIPPRQRAVLLFPLAIAVAVTSIVFAARAGSGSNCVPTRAVASVRPPAKAKAQPKLCRPGMMTYSNIGK